MSLWIFPDAGGAQAPAGVFVQPIFVYAKEAQGLYLMY
jgi:hypothetical protein